MQQFRVNLALRTAVFGLLAFTMAQLMALSLLTVLGYALRGEISALSFAPLSAVAMLLTVIAMRELATGLQSR